jgi:hypothetical protein
MAYRAQDILEGKHQNTFSEWLLRGNLGEPFVPTAVLAVFPTPAVNSERFVYERVAFMGPEGDSPERQKRYWEDILTLNLPERVKSLEALQYGPLAGGQEDMLSHLKISLATALMPSVMVAFSKSPTSEQESAYLICATMLPPSEAYKHIVDQAGKELVPQNRAETG